VNAKLGVLAIESSLLTAEEVEIILALQKSKDMRFGELAVAEGYLSPEQVDKLLEFQKKANVLIGQVLIEDGIISYQTYERILAEYKEQSGFSEEEIKLLQDKDIRGIIDIFWKCEETKNNTTIKEYIELFARNLIRFIDSEIMIEKINKISRLNLEEEFLIAQEVKGDLELYTGLVGKKEDLEEVASAFMGSIWVALESERPACCNSEDCLSEITVDSLGEFMNCHNGLFLSNLSNLGQELDLYPPYCERTAVVPEEGMLLRVDFGMAKGKISLIVLFIQEV